MSGEQLLQRVPAAVERRGRRVPSALHGAAAAAYTVAARAGSLTTLAAMLVLAGAVAASTEGPLPSGAAATTLQDSGGAP